MQKFVSILEQYVEWVALAIGGLFLAAMVALYLVDTPVSAKIGERTVTLSNIESEILNGPANRIESALQNKELPRVEVPSYTEKYGQHVAMDGTKPIALAVGPWIGAGAPVANLKAGSEQDTGRSGRQTATGLMIPPQAEPFKASMGKSNVSLTEVGATLISMSSPSAQPGIGSSPAPGFGPSPNFGPPPPSFAVPPAGTGSAAPSSGTARQPGQAVAGTGVSRGTAQTTSSAKASEKPDDKLGADNKTKGADRVWVTQSFIINKEDLAKAFEDRHVPGNLTTAMLRVEMVRQELLPGGADQWGNDTPINPLGANKVPAMPAGSDMAAQDEYLNWALTNPSTVLIPPFYSQLAGDTWYAPGRDNPNVVIIENKPVLPTPAINRRTRQNMFPGGAGGMPGGVMPGGRTRRSRGGSGSVPPGIGPGMRAPQDADRPVRFYQGMPDSIRQMQQAMAEMGRRSLGGSQPGGAPQAGSTAITGADLPENTTVPQGEFRIDELTGDIFVWCHDDTAQPDKTYRYKMRYALKNPVYRHAPMAGKPEHARVLAVVSEFSDWSEPVTTPSISEFYVAANFAPSSNSVRFNVFRWQGGSWHMKVFTASPGDEIGAEDGDIDYATGWILVDLSSDAVRNNEARVMVADPNGDLQARTFRDDQGDERQFKASSGWTDPNAAPKTPAASGYPGGFPAGVMPPPPPPPPGMMPGAMPRTRNR